MQIGVDIFFQTSTELLQQKHESEVNTLINNQVFKKLLHIISNQLSDSFFPFLESISILLFLLSLVQIFQCPYVNVFSHNSDFILKE